MNSSPIRQAAARPRQFTGAGKVARLPFAVAAAWLASFSPLVFGAASPPASQEATVNYADLTLEQLMDLKVGRVYGASRHVQKITQAPSSVSIVTADEIRQFGWRTLGDVLRSVRGFHTFDDRNYTYLGLRGFLRPGDFNTRALVLIDGHRTNDNIYDSAYIGREQMVATSLIERVEVIRGPSSSVYGSSAFFGVINVVTKKPGENAGEITVDVGNNHSFETQLTISRRFANGVRWMISGSNYTSEGEKRLYFPDFDQRISANPLAANDGVAVDADGERSAQIFTSLAYKDLTVSAMVSRRLKEVPTASYATVFNHRTERTADRRGYVDLKYDRAMGDHRLLARMFYDRYRYDGRYPYDYAPAGDPPDIMAASDASIGESAGTELQFNTRLSAEHTLIVGTEFRESFREDQLAYYPETPQFADRRRSRTLGLFAQWEAALRKDLALTVGARLDRYYGSFGNALNPRLGLIYNLNEVSTIKLLYGSAFRAPNPYERYYYTAQTFSPALEPERVRTQELVFERYFGRVFRANLSLYHIDVVDLVSLTTDAAGDLYFENLDGTHAHGAEIEFESKHDSGWLARISYAWQESESRPSKQPSTGSPRGLGKLNVAWAPSGKALSAGVEVQYQAGSRTLAGARSDDFVVANVHLVSGELLRSFEFSVTAANVFDTRYAVPGAVDHTQDVLPQGRRALRLKVTRKF